MALVLGCVVPNLLLTYDGGVGSHAGYSAISDTVPYRASGDIIAVCVESYSNYEQKIYPTYQDDQDYAIPLVEVVFAILNIYLSTKLNPVLSDIKDIIIGLMVDMRVTRVERLSRG